MTIYSRMLCSPYNPSFRLKSTMRSWLFWRNSTWSCMTKIWKPTEMWPEKLIYSSQSALKFSNACCDLQNWKKPYSSLFLLFFLENTPSAALLSTWSFYILRVRESCISQTHAILEYIYQIIDKNNLLNFILFFVNNKALFVVSCDDQEVSPSRLPCTACWMACEGSIWLSVVGQNLQHENFCSLIKTRSYRPRSPLSSSATSSFS